VKELSTAPGPDVTNNRTTALYGAGLGYAYSKNVSFRGEYENYGTFGYMPGTNPESTGRLKFSVWSVGLEFHFR
jgi:opacity protein-like surface antigen